MRSNMSIAGIVLIVLGALALAYQGFTYTRSENVIDLGSLQVTAQDRKTVPLPPIVGFLAVAGGIGLIVMDRRRQS